MDYGPWLTDRGQGSKHIASRKYVDRLISLFLNISGVHPMANRCGGEFYPDIEGGSKSTYCRTEDAKPSGHAEAHDHPQRPAEIYQYWSPLVRKYISSSHTYRLHDDVCDLAIQATTNHNQSK